MSPELFSSLLISSQLISVFLKFSQLFSTLLSSPQLMSAHLVSSHLFHEPSHIFQALLTSPQLISALVSSSHLISALLSALSNHLSSSPARNLLQKRISAPKQATPALSTGKILHREAFALLLHTASFYTQQAFTHSKLLQREAFTHRLHEDLAYAKELEVVV